jgi:predicted glycoside hydrolase/deacetylase ChbG (UPF0249 family)
MRIILNADDFGLSDEITAATIDCFNRGGLTSATILVKMPGSAGAIEFAKANPQFSFGVHLTFVRDTVEAPVSNPADVSDLVSSDGGFLSSNTIRRKALLGRIAVDQIEREVTAQVELLRSHGVKVSHLDSHGHLHKFAPFRKALRNLKSRLGIERIRGVQNVYLRKPIKSPTYWLGGWWGRKLRALFKTTDHFYMPTSAVDKGWPQTLLSRVGGYSLEVGVHPGYSEPWRVAESATARQFAEVAKAAGHQLITWNDL